MWLLNIFSFYNIFFEILIFMGTQGFNSGQWSIALKFVQLHVSINFTRQPGLTSLANIEKHIDSRYLYTYGIYNLSTHSYKNR